MLSRIALPPGFTVRIDYDLDQAPLDVTVRVHRQGVWIGEVTAAAERLANTEELQAMVDTLTRRRARAFGT